jgi:hypothetical protein
MALFLDALQHSQWDPVGMYFVRAACAMRTIDTASYNLSKKPGTPAASESFKVYISISGAFKSKYTRALDRNNVLLQSHLLPT